MAFARAHTHTFHIQAYLSSRTSGPPLRVPQRSTIPPSAHYHPRCCQGELIATTPLLLILFSYAAHQPLPSLHACAVRATCARCVPTSRDRVYYTAVLYGYTGEVSELVSLMKLCLLDSYIVNMLLLSFPLPLLCSHEQEAQGAQSQSRASQPEAPVSFPF